MLETQCTINRDNLNFIDWDALAAENRRIWEAYYLWPAYEPWDTWQGWMAEHRTLVAAAQEVYEAQYGEKRDSNAEP